MRQCHGVEVTFHEDHGIPRERKEGCTHPLTPFDPPPGSIQEWACS